MHRSIRRSIENKFMSHYHQMLVCQLSRNCHNKHGWGIDRQGKNKCCLICISVIQITYFYILLSICFPMLIIKADLYLPNKTKCDLVCLLYEDWWRNLTFMKTIHTMPYISDWCFVSSNKYAIYDQLCLFRILFILYLYFIQHMNIRNLLTRYMII